MKRAMRSRRSRRPMLAPEMLETRRLLAGSISGTVFNDPNSNGVQNPGELGIPSWTLYLDANNNNVLDGGEVTTATNASGQYTFSGLAAGEYNVKQQLQTGYRKTLPPAGTPGYTTTITGDEAKTGFDFGDTTNIYLAGHVYNDANSNGVQDQGESGIQGVTVNIISNATIIATRVTDATGFWQVKGLSQGTGSAEIVVPAGYTPVNPANAKYSGSASSGEQIGNLNFGLEAAAPVTGFTPGNFVVYRVGDGSEFAQSDAVPVFLDEYTPTGTLVQSVAMPTAASGNNRQFVASGTATTEGMLTRSADGRYLVMGGYDAPVGTPEIASSTTVAAGIVRVIARVSADATIDTTTSTTSHSSGSIRGVASLDGSAFWSTGAASGVRYETLGGSGTATGISNTVNNARNIGIFNGQLYISTASGAAVRLGAVGTGTPTASGAAAVNIPGFPTAGSPYGFFFADLNAGVPGVDTVYVADDAAGLQKYSLSDGSWTLNGTVGGDADDYRGITGVINGNSVTLVLTRKGGSSPAGGGELVTLVDSGGYNANFSNTSPTLIASAAAGTSFRGVAPTPVVASITASAAPAAPSAAPAFTAASNDVLESTYEGFGFFA